MATTYCCNEGERDAASAKLGGKPACVAEAERDGFDLFLSPRTRTFVISRIFAVSTQATLLLPWSQ